MKRHYTVLTVSFALWFAALTPVLAPTIGLTQQIYPPPQFCPYKLYYLILSSVTTAVYSAYIGVKLMTVGERRNE